MRQTTALTRSWFSLIQVGFKLLTKGSLHVCVPKW